MKLKDFVEEFNNLPDGLEAFAEGAATVDDCDELSDSARDLIRAACRFENMLEKYGVEIG